MQTQALIDEPIIRRTREWLQNFVIELNLCPFAGQAFLQNAIRYTVYSGQSEAALLEKLKDEVDHLRLRPEVATTLLIHPNVLVDFSEYNQFLDTVEVLLKQFQSEGEFQVASFHPGYQFSETQLQDPENYSNRSPFPMLHILRESMLSDAIDSHPNIEQIPANNILRLRSIGAEQLRLQLSALYK